LINTKNSTFGRSTDDYKQHTSCVTEAERYEKTLYKGPRKNDTNGRKLTPQESWIEIIHASLTNSPPAITPYLKDLSSFDNVPRKEKAFRNFATNSLKLRGANGNAIITSIWNHLKAIREERHEQTPLEGEGKESVTDQKEIENEKQDSVESSCRSEEPKVDDISGEDTVPIKTKKIAKAMKKDLKKTPSKQMQLKELRKLVKKKLELDAQTLKKIDLKKAIARVITDDESITTEGKVVKLVA
jgi:cell growth-regulating nucleolar protein